MPISDEKAYKRYVSAKTMAQLEHVILESVRTEKKRDEVDGDYAVRMNFCFRQYLFEPER